MILENFESQIDPKIVERGYEYFKDEAVEDLIESPKGHWAATVLGSDEYRVSVSVNRNEITLWECDCPYDHGPICKHVTAVLFSIRDIALPSAVAEIVDEPKRSDKVSTDKKTDKTKKKAKAKNPVEDLIQSLSPEELTTFVLEQVRHNVELKNALITSFAEKQEGNAYTKYVTLIRSIANNCAGKHGFIDYRAASKFIVQIMALCDKATKLLGQNNLLESLAITKAIIEELPQIVMAMDDSNGGAGEIWSSAFENFEHIVEKAPPMLKDDLFDYCLAQYPIEKYHNCSFESNFIDILPSLVKSGSQEKAFFILLDQRIAIEKKKDYGEYTVVELLKAKIKYLEENNRSAEAMEIIRNNVDISDFRSFLLKKALVRNDYDEAKQLCYKGIEIAEAKKHPGTVTQYKIGLLEIFEKERNIPQVCKMAEKLFFDNHYSLEYYRKLKKYWDRNTWNEKCEEIINIIKTPKSRGGYYDAEALASVFVEEAYSDRLLKLLQINDTRLSFIDTFAKHIANRYPAEILTLYENAIAAYAEDTGRSVYNDIARYMKKVAKLTGGPDVVNKLVAQFRMKYRNRRAMMETLDKHFT